MVETSPRSACVIGGTGGLGQAICRSLVDDWSGLLFTYRSRREEAATLEHELSAHIPVASSFVDLCDFASVSAALAAATQRFGAVGTVVFAAGVTILQPYVAQITSEQWNE